METVEKKRAEVDDTKGDDDMERVANMDRVGDAMRESMEVVGVTVVEGAVQ